MIECYFMISLPGSVMRGRRMYYSKSAGQADHLLRNGASIVGSIKRRATDLPSNVSPLLDLLLVLLTRLTREQQTSSDPSSESPYMRVWLCEESVRSN